MGPIENKVSNIDDYISKFPKQTKDILEEIRTIVNVMVPDAEEFISYGIPTFRLNGKNLVHFAGYEHHIGFYPTSTGIDAFRSEISKFKHAKGSVQFPLDDPIPYELIRKMVRFRIEEIISNTSNVR